MANLYIMVGIPGCGKSTFAKNYLNDGKAAVVSSDAIRAEISTAYDQSLNDQVFKVFHRRIREHLDHDVDVVADATHLTRRSRAETADCAGPWDKVHVVFFKNPLQALERNRNRNGHSNGEVPGDVMMQRMLPRYEETCRDLPQERYDSVIEIRSMR
jgi:predicted kinase